MTEQWTIEELIQVADEAQRTRPERPLGLVTGPEYARLAGISEKTARNRLKALMEVGLAEPGHEILTETIHGVKARLKGWKLNMEAIQAANDDR